MPRLAVKCKFAKQNDSCLFPASDIHLVLGLEDFKNCIINKNAELIAEIIDSKSDEYKNNTFEIKLYTNESRLIDMLRSN